MIIISPQSVLGLYATWGYILPLDVLSLLPDAMQTGTLTENRMTVVEGWFAGKQYDRVPQMAELPADFGTTFQASVAVNSSVRQLTEQHHALTTACTPPELLCVHNKPSACAAHISWCTFC